MASNAANIGNQAIQAYGNQRTVVPSAGGGIVTTPAQAADPFNWKGIAAQLKAEEQRKAQAKTRITNPTAPKALQAVAAAAPTDPFAGMSPKEQLDFFRMTNEGALPPGMTPEMASMIDSGIDINGIAATNPAIANVMMQMQQLITQLPADYAAGKASVNQSYDQLTGDVLNSGKQWMQDLYGRVVDPNDPNAALAQQDPALTQYAQGMSTIDETSDQNRATDLAWFDKMQQNAASTYQGLIASLAAQAATATAAKGSGGGGGGHGRGHGGGGGGGSGKGSVNQWKIPTNTLTNATSATDTATQTDSGYSPGFHEALMEATQFDPELQALTERIWEQSPQDARGLTQEVAKRLTEAETQQQDLALQGGLHQSWLKNTPGTAQTAISQLLRNKPGAIMGDDPSTKNIVERYHFPEQPGGSNVPQVIVPTPEQDSQNALGEELLANSSKYGARQLTNKIFGTKLGFDVKPGVASPERLLEEQSKGAISPAQIKILAQRGQKDLLAAQKGDTTESPFNWKGWAESGGYVPEADSVAGRLNAKNINYYNYILDTILPWNPNANTVPTSEKMVSQGKDSSTYQTKNTSKSWANALPGSPLDLTPDIPNVGLQSNPVTNPTGFTITPGKTPQADETVDVAPLTSEVSDFGGVGLTAVMNPKRPALQSYDRPAVKTAAMVRAGVPAPAPAPVAAPVSPARNSIFDRMAAAVRPNLSEIIFGAKTKMPVGVAAPVKKPASAPKKSVAPKKTVQSRIGPR